MGSRGAQGDRHWEKTEPAVGVCPGVMDGCEQFPLINTACTAEGFQNMMDPTAVR